MNRHTSAAARDVVVPLPPSLRTTLHDLSLLCLATGAAFPATSPTLHLYTDASDDGWGASLPHLHLTGLWTPHERMFHMNCKELLAVLKALRKSKIQDMTLAVHLDNSTAVRCLHRLGSTRGQVLNRICKLIETNCKLHNLQLLPQYIPGHMNVIADALSRTRPLPGEWKLDPSVFKRTCQKWGYPEVDLFATHLNNQLPVFVSPLPTADLHDALTIPWHWDFLYAFPPSKMLLRLLHRILALQQQFIIIFPWWPHRPWFPLLMSLLKEDQWMLPLSPQMLSQEVQGQTVYHPSPQILKLHAGRL
jgi:hypothetical protein